VLHQTPIAGFIGQLQTKGKGVERRRRKWGGERKNTVNIYSWLRR